MRTFTEESALQLTASNCRAHCLRARNPGCPMQNGSRVPQTWSRANTPLQSWSPAKQPGLWLTWSPGSSLRRDATPTGERAGQVCRDLGDPTAQLTSERRGRSAYLADLQRSVPSRANGRAGPQASCHWKMQGAGVRGASQSLPHPRAPFPLLPPRLHLNLGLSTSSRAQFPHPYSSLLDGPLIPVLGGSHAPGGSASTGHKLPSSKAEPAHYCGMHCGLPGSQNLFPRWGVAVFASGR